MQHSRADILLVDENPVVRHSLTALLERAGHSVATAAHAGEAVDYLRRRPRPRLILLELIKEAWQLLSARHQDPALADIPVVALSPTGRAVRSTALALGADDFLDSPTDDDDLRAVVGRYC
jgi:CheY-like chemotaxis protein